MGLIGLKFEYIRYGSEHRILLLHVKNELQAFRKLCKSFSGFFVEFKCYNKRDSRCV